MASYAFFKHRQADTVPVFELAEFDSDDDARRHAVVLLTTGPQYDHVDVCDGSSEPVTVDRCHVPDHRT